MTVGFINYSYSGYTGTNNDIKKSFELTYKNNPIFQRYFDGSSSLIVSAENDVVRIPYHYFVTGEEIKYSFLDSTSNPHQPIGIATTSVVGIGTTNLLPETLYVVKINDYDIKLAASAEDALRSIPKVFDITSVGIGSSHIFTSKKQNNKVIIGIDNLIQSPIVSSSSTTLLSNDVGFFDEKIYVTNTNFISGGDLLKIDDEIMKVVSVGISSTNAVSILRPWLGTEASTHSSSTVVTKVYGNYNIVNNTIYFEDAPYGKVPIPNPTNRADEVDYVGIETSSTFSGRVFLRSGVADETNETYLDNYIFDTVSNDFDGIKKSFDLKLGGSNVTGFSTDNAILLVNSIFQGPDDPEVNGDYDINENSGITSVTFSGNSSSNNYDVNTASIPRGGIILSVGSTQGFGYQPLVAAGGTAIVSLAGTIQSISIGNSGSGYRPGVQTIVNVGVKTESFGESNIEYIGIASISGGNIVSVAITNPGYGYTSSNPPIVIFDSPLSYTNLPLVYSSQSTAGVGTGAMVDIVVGQGSSVISFDIKTLGYGYKQNEILTVSIGGTSGIQTDTSLAFSEFQITIDKTQSDQFAAWTVGRLVVLDSIEEYFDGNRKIFPIIINGQQTTIKAKKGSNIDVQATLLVFINDVLQVPGRGYTFRGGSIIRFAEPPKEGDKCKILFYSGTADVDTKEVDILETIKVGDNVRINDDSMSLSQDSRLVTNIISADAIETNLYPGPGISQKETLLRPLTWCKHQEDILVNGKSVGKDRIIYEPYIQPATNIIQNVSTSSTIVFVESVKAFFDSEKEYTHDGTTEKPQNKIIIISQDTVVSSSATAIVSVAGTISMISISEGGAGYTTSPTVSISNPIGVGTTGVATATATVINGEISSIDLTYEGFGYNQSDPPYVLISPPSPKYEIIDKVSYEGDYGIITGINTVSVGVASTGITFDFYIPQDSILRDNDIISVGIATTGISGIQTGYYFTVFNSNVGNGVTSLNSDGSIVGVGTSFIDNIYQVASVSIGQTSVPGIGITNVTKVVVSVSSYNNLTGIGFSDFYGEYSWGLVKLPSRLKPKDFTTYANNGGISTSPVIQRFNRLKYIGYSTT